jgi:hypothetical protein
MTLTPSKLKKLQQTTILIEHIDAAIIPCTARRAITFGPVLINAGQSFYLVRSGDDATRYYVVAWSDRDIAYLCSCGCPAYKSHKHTQLVNTWVATHRVQPVTTSSGVKPLPRATDVTTGALRATTGTTESLPTAQHDDMLRRSLNGNRAFNLYK